MIRIVPRIFVPALAAWLAAAATAPSVATAEDRGRIVGKVIAAESGEPVPYADVSASPVDSLSGRRAGVMTNADGTFRLEVTPGIYDLRVRALSYATKTVTRILVANAGAKELTVSLAPDAVQQDEVVVEGKAVLDNEAALLSQRKRAASVGDAVSAEQVRKSPDRDAGDVLRRVTGTSLVDGKYVFVRGMGERYSSTEMDGVRIASPEQNKRVVPLDMVPSSLLENIVVQKTYTADRPGEFGGGDVQIHTKDFPAKRTFALSLGGTYVPQTSFQSVLSYEGAPGDAWAMGAGARAIPRELLDLSGGKRIGPGIERYPYDSLATIGASFRNQWSPVAQNAHTPANFLVSFGDQYQVNGRPLGLVASVGSSHGIHQASGEEILYEGTADTKVYDYAVQSFTRSALFSMMAGASYWLTPQHELSLKATQSRSADDETRTYFGFNQSQSSNFQVDRLRYLERVISTFGVDGRHELPGLGHSTVRWTASLSEAARREPDRREVQYRQNVDETGTSTEPLYYYTGTRDWGDLEDHGLGFDGSARVPFRGIQGREAHVDVGGSLQSKNRNSTYRRFSFGNNAFDIDPTAPAESLFDGNEWTVAGNRAYVSETTQPEDSYDADQRIHAGFVSVDALVLPRLRAIAGARVEHGLQRVTTYDLFSGATVDFADLDDWDVLPTLNLVYTLDDRTNVRLAGARTLSRPDLRELTNGRTLNFFNGYQDIGNPDLERASIWNFDLRGEMYPGLSEVVALGVFYKAFDQPIEKQIGTGASDRLLVPMNSDHGHNVGVEIEARQGLGRYDARLAKFFVNLNGSWISSRIYLKPQTTLTTNPVHPLQGQSDVLANVGVGYGAGQNWDATVLVTSVGRRLYALGQAGVTDDIDETPATMLDAVVNYAPIPGWRLKLGAKNLTNTGTKQTQGDRVVQTHEGDRAFSLAVSFGQ